MRTAVLAITLLAGSLIGLSPATANEHGAADSVRVCDNYGCRYTAAAPGPKTDQMRLIRQASKSGGAGPTRVGGKTFHPTPGVVSYHSDATRWVKAARVHLGKSGEQLNMKWSRGNGRKSLWCGEFMGKLADAVGMKKPRNPDLASNWAEVGQRINSPLPGAVALISWNGGRSIHHVGIVTGVDPNGNPIIISGNHNNRVVETAYPKRTMAAYIMPSG